MYYYYYFLSTDAPPPTTTAHDYYITSLYVSHTSSIHERSVLIYVTLRSCVWLVGSGLQVRRSAGPPQGWS